MTGSEVGHGEARKIVSVEITKGPGPLPHGILEQAPRVIATVEGGDRVELFSFYADERWYRPIEFAGLSIAEGRMLKFARDHRLPRRRPESYARRSSDNV